MSRAEIFLWAVCIAGGFLSGSVLFSRLIPKIFLHKDICAVSDDRNPGAVNVFAYCGIFWGIICLCLDILKGFLPVFLGVQILNTDQLLFAAAAAAPVLGHAAAPFDHFHGGKCISTAFGALLGLYPLTKIVFLLAGIYIVFSTLLKIPSTRLRSIISFGLFGVLSAAILIYEGMYSAALGCFFISCIAVLKHSRFFAYIQSETPVIDELSNEKLS